VSGPATDNPFLKRDATLDLALIGNCAIGALVDRYARIVWCCMPRFDSDPVFHALLDSGDGVGHDGTLAVELEGAVRSEQFYEPGTAVVRTRLFDAAGHGIEVTDFAPRFWVRERMFHPAQLVRRIRPLNGRPRVRLIVRPRSEWGATAPTLTRGSNHVRYVSPFGTLRLSTDAPLTYVLDETWFSLHGPISMLLGPDASHCRSNGRRR